MKIVFLLLIVGLLVVLTSCQLGQPPLLLSGSPEPIATTLPTDPTPVQTLDQTIVEVTRVVDVFVEQETIAPEAEKSLTVCLSSEPTSLYPHGRNLSKSDLAVQHAIYENDFTYLTYAYQPVGLEKLPSFEDRDLFFRTVEVAQGDSVVEAESDLPVSLQIGMMIRDSEGNLVQFDGTPVMMRQMVADFKLKPRTWSDGRAVTASDSLFSYEMAAHPDTPTDKYRISRTESYEVLNELTIRWAGLPGFEDREVPLNFVKPLPQHIMETLTPADLVNAEVSARRPIGDGPFKLVSWERGKEILLERNRNYYRAVDGLPHLDWLRFRFFDQPGTLLSQLLSRECDVVTQDGLDFRDASLLIDAASRDLLTVYFENGTVYEHIDFGINSIPGYGDYNGRPDWFEDKLVRQGMTLCTDRERMNREIFFGSSELLHSYFPSDHPLFDPAVARYPYDLEQGNALLDDAGFVDTDGDGIRESFDGTPFSVSLGTTTGNLMRQQIGQIFAENMSACGIDVDLYYLPSEEWFASGPEGPLFGRQFDLGEFGWNVDEFFSCLLYTSDQIPGPVESGLAGWDGLNVTGWRNADFDNACDRARAAFPGSDDYINNHQLAQRIFADELPVMPLFLRVKVAATGPDILNFDLDPTQESELYNVYEIDVRR